MEEVQIEKNNVNVNVHVIVLPFPGQGHLSPLLQFAKRLASKGVKATLATTSHTLSSITAANITVEPISDGIDSFNITTPANVEHFLTSFETNGSRTLSELVQKYQHTTSPVTCIVYDSYLPWALDVAKQHNIYSASFFTNSAALSNIFCRIHHGLLELPVKEEELPVLIPGIPVPMNARDLPIYITLTEANRYFLQIKMMQLTSLKNADWMLINTFEALEPEAVKELADFYPVKTIGPMVPSAYLDGRIEGDKSYGASLWKPLGEECQNWLESKPPQSVVYVSFGSTISFTEEQMEEVALGLKESGMSFLWVVREAEQSKLPVGFQDSVKEKGLVVTWCNQLELLDNQAIGCFVSHCGWNSTIESLSLGVPVVCMPLWDDQLVDAKYLEEIWESGVWPMKDEKEIVRRDELVKCLKVAMEGERSEVIRRNAAKWKNLAKEAVSEGGSSDELLNEFVSSLINAEIPRKKEEN